MYMDNCFHYPPILGFDVVGQLATTESLKRFDADGSSIKIGDVKWVLIPFNVLLPTEIDQFFPKTAPKNQIG